MIPPFRSPRAVIGSRSARGVQMCRQQAGSGTRRQSSRAPGKTEAPAAPATAARSEAQRGDGWTPFPGWCITTGCTEAARSAAAAAPTWHCQLRASLRLPRTSSICAAAPSTFPHLGRAANELVPLLAPRLARCRKPARHGAVAGAPSRSPVGSSSAQSAAASHRRSGGPTLPLRLLPPPCRPRSRATWSSWARASRPCTWLLGCPIAWHR